MRDGNPGTRTLALRGRIITETEVWKEGTILIEDGVICRVSREPLSADRVVEMPQSYLAPGFVDLQVNGAFGVDAVAHPQRLGDLSAALPATGVTSYLPTLVTLPLERYPEVIEALDLQGGDGWAEPLGLHLEGPFISPKKRGAHAAEGVSPPNAVAFRQMLDTTRVALVTLAPELLGSDHIIALASKQEFIVSAGHSNASYEESKAGFEQGAKSVTHLFNAMSPLHHRDPGLPGAALTAAEVRCGIIADGRHVHPEMIRLAYERLGPDRMYLVTDAMAATGMGPGEYELAGSRVFMQDGVPRLESGTLAGSVLTMDEALRNIMSFTDCSLPEAVRMAATTPAGLIGASGSKGRLAEGCDADVVALSADLEVEAAWVNGREAAPKEYTEELSISSTRQAR